MKITKTQLRRIIKEEKAKLAEAKTPQIRRKITDVDTGRVHNVTALAEPTYGFITLSFGTSFTLHLDADALNELYSLLEEAEHEMYDGDVGEEDNSASIDAFLNAVPSAERA